MRFYERPCSYDKSTSSAHYENLNHEEALSEHIAALLEGSLRETPNKNATHTQVTKITDVAVYIIHLLKMIKDICTTPHELMVVVEVEVPIPSDNGHYLNLPGGEDDGHHGVPSSGNGGPLDDHYGAGSTSSSSKPQRR